MSPLRGSNGIAFGPDGRLYVAEFLGGRISAVDVATGEIEVAVPPDGPVQSPDDLAFGADGSMYITDLVPGTVWRRDPYGDYTVVSDEVMVPNGIACLGDRLFVNEMRVGGRMLELFPDGRAPVVLADGLMMGNAMQVGPDGSLYYPHMLTNEVWRVPLGGGAPELVAEDVHDPVAVRFDAAGVLVVLSRGTAGIITRIDLFGSGQRQVVTTGVFDLDNAAFDNENRMYVSSFASSGIAEVYPDGEIRQIVPQGFVGPYGVTVDAHGTVYAADHYRVPGTEMPPFAHGIAAADGMLHVTSQYGEVRTYDPVARTTVVRASGLDRPVGIAARDDGVLVVAEVGAGRVVLVSDTVTVLADGFAEPVDVALDTAQRCYVSDESRGVVYRIDGGRPVPFAEGLAAPQGLAVRGDELFVVETGQGRLLAIHLDTGSSRVHAKNLPVSPPEKIDRALCSSTASPAGPAGSPEWRSVRTARYWCPPMRRAR